jgi:hypothetical protein
MNLFSQNIYYVPKYWGFSSEHNRQNLIPHKVYTTEKDMLWLKLTAELAVAKGRVPGGSSACSRVTKVFNVDDTERTKETLL